MSALLRVSSTLSRRGVEVGRVKALWRYPVKSMGAESLSKVEVSWQGLAGDRRWAFVREGMVRSGFPWLTIRERSDLSHFLPSFLEPDRPDVSRTVVRTPSGQEFDVVDPALAVDLGSGSRAIKCDRGVFDTLPLALLSTQTIASLGAIVHSTLDPLRFRPNLLIDAVGGAPFPEDAWVGSILRVGAAWIRADKRDQRCVVVTVDPTTGERNPTILRAIARERQACLGIYASTVAPGAVSLGDPVVLFA
jgi:uncharacterized protein